MTGPYIIILLFPTVCNQRAKSTPITVCSLRIPAWSGVCKYPAFDHTSGGIAVCEGVVLACGDLIRVALVIVRVTAVCD